MLADRGRDRNSLVEAAAAAGRLWRPDVKGGSGSGVAAGDGAVAAANANMGPSGDKQQSSTTFRAEISIPSDSEQ